MSATADDKDASGGGKGSGGGKLVMIVAIVNLVMTIAMVGILFVSFQRDKKAPAVEDMQTGNETAAHGGEEAGGHGEGHGESKGIPGLRKKKADYGKMVSLEQFTVNLSTPGSLNPKFVRVNVSLEMPTEDAENEVNAKMPQVRNAIIDLFNSKRPTDLATTEGRDYLKDEIKNALNAFLIHGKVKGVFFTNFSLSS